MTELQSATPSAQLRRPEPRRPRREQVRVRRRIAGGAEFIKVGGCELPARAYVSSFNFRGPDQQKTVGALSGGERNRVHLAKLLESGQEFDVDTLRALRGGLESFPGCAVVISHDRWFLDRIATHVLAFEGDGVISAAFEGNFTEYEEYRARAGYGRRSAAPPIRYKQLRVLAGRRRYLIGHQLGLRLALVRQPTQERRQTARFRRRAG